MRSFPMQERLSSQGQLQACAAWILAQSQHACFFCPSGNCAFPHKCPVEVRWPRGVASVRPWPSSSSLPLSSSDMASSESSPEPMSAVLAPPLGHWHPASSRAGALALPAGALAFEGGAEADKARPNRARKPGIAGDVELGLAVCTGTCCGLMNRILVGGALSSLQFAANASRATAFNAGVVDSRCIHAGRRGCAHGYICSEHGGAQRGHLRKLVSFLFSCARCAESRRILRKMRRISAIWKTKFV
jgi:hypothetical protein